MAKKCLYCQIELDDKSVIDFCKKCGVGVFGVKMFDAIVSNMEKAADEGDLCHNAQIIEPPKNLEGFGALNP